jgi:putative zinc finger/helix-turn-helix YgiT family protein
VKMERCVQCGKAAVTVARVKLERRIVGRLFLTTVLGTRCGACGEDYVSAPDLRRFELLTARTLADAGQSSGAAFKFMRKAMGLKATDLAVLLGVTAETISRWENDKHAPERSTLAVMASLLADQLAGSTRTADALQAMGRPKKLGKRIQLKVA